MKKFLTLFLAVVMVFSLSIPAFAETTSDALGSDKKDTSIPVTVTTTTAENNKVYKVDVSWTSTTFTYEFGNQGTWNPSTHKYDGPSTVPVGWNNEEKSTITVANHSNVSVDVTAEIVAETPVGGATVTLEGAAQDGKVQKNIAAPAITTGETTTTAPSDTIVVKISGEPTKVSQATIIANIKITIA